ncbi:MAG: hypothetical protein AB8B55_16770 [Mariniblastus sp.]
MSRDQQGNSQLNEDNDLQWLAFCYIAEELSEPETAQFEARLETDQAAREAVSNAVAQGQLVFAAIESDGSSLSEQSTAEKKQIADASNGLRSNTRRSAVLFAAAAALLMMVGGWAWMNFQPTSPIASDTEGLAEVWVDTLVAMSDDSTSPEGLLMDESEFELENSLVANSVNEDFVVETDSEDWMYVALTDMENSLGEFE